MKEQTKNNAQSIIDNLLLQAEENKDAVEQWKSEHSEAEEHWKSMTREEQTNYIIDLLEQLGLVEPDYTKGLTEEDKDNIRTLYLGGIDWTSSRIEDYVPEHQVLYQTLGVPKQAPISFMLLGFIMGVDYGAKVYKALNELGADEVTDAAEE